MARILEKRRSLHKNLHEQLRQNETLKLQVDQLQALANVGVCTSMIAHELNNILTPLINYALLALRHPDDSELTAKALTKVSNNCQKASDIMQSILSVVTGETENIVETPLLALTEQVFNCICRDFAKDAITVQLDIPSDLTVYAVPIQLQQVMMNLILNAREAMLENGGTLTITAKKNRSAVKIEVSDTGCGIPREYIDNIFDPFFTTKKRSTSETSGSGLGLSYCLKTVQKAGGTIEVESLHGVGTTFTITLAG